MSIKYKFTRQKPVEKGIYIWRSGDTGFSIVLVHKRPTQHSPAGELCGTILKPNEFYNNCAIEKAWAGEWMGPITNDPSEFPEDMYQLKVKLLAESLTSAEKDTLHALLLNGPLDDGDVPSKTGRDLLIEKDLATRVIVKASDGYQAATFLGRDVFKYLKSCDRLKDALQVKNTQ